MFPTEKTSQLSPSIDLKAADSTTFLMLGGGGIWNNDGALPREIIYMKNGCCGGNWQAGEAIDGVIEVGDFIWTRLAAWLHC